MQFCCPLCKGALENRDKTWVCPKGHSYDIAAEGYVHLLPPNKMHSKVPGDNKQMVRSRREFLEGGHYQLFSDTLNQLVAEAVAEKERPVLLDAGCGEGYYTHRMREFLQSQGKQPEVNAFDISKFAVKAAAKRDKKTAFAVASIFSIPVADAAVDCLVDVFAPIVEAEFARVVREDGFLILAVPGERHLFGLKEILYEEPYENDHKETEYAGFRFVKRVPVCGELHLTDSKDILDLFSMTPYYWKTSIEGSRRLQEIKALTTHIQFDFLVYKKEK